jgi:hypothetical protein
MTGSGDETMLGQKGVGLERKMFYHKTWQRKAGADMKTTAVRNNARHCLLVLAALFVLAFGAGCGGKQELAADQMWGRADATEIDVNSKSPGAWWSFW